MSTHSNAALQPADASEQSPPVAQKFGSWDTAFSPVREVMPKGAIEQCLDIISRWQCLFPLANTWVGQKHRVPSLFVRLDCVIAPDGEVKVYEVEERPCGFGLTASCNSSFAQRLVGVQQTWPAIRWVKSEHRHTDDELWFGQGLDLAEARNYDGCLLVRSRPEETAFHELEDRAVSSVSKEGDKNYGVDLGWWNTITVADDGSGSLVLSPSLPDAAVLKPTQGTRSRLIKVYLTTERRQNLRDRGFAVNGSDSLTQLTKLVGKQPNRQMFCQPFVEPMLFLHQPGRNGIHRIFFGFNLETGAWVPLGGVWMALDDLIVHGTNRTITGALTVEE